MFDFIKVSFICSVNINLSTYVQPWFNRFSIWPHVYTKFVITQIWNSIFRQFYPLKLPDWSMMQFSFKKDSRYNFLTIACVRKSIWRFYDYGHIPFKNTLNRCFPWNSFISYLKNLITWRDNNGHFEFNQGWIQEYKVSFECLWLSCYREKKEYPGWKKSLKKLNKIPH